MSSLAPYEAWEADKRSTTIETVEAENIFHARMIYIAKRGLATDLIRTASDLQRRIMVKPISSAIKNRITAACAVSSDGCWVCNLRTTKAGYCLIGYEKETRRADWVAYEAFIGPLPASTTLEHLCGNLRCINPEHMRTVHKTNPHDPNNKNRNLAIWRRWSGGEATSEIATSVGISRTRVSQIIARQKRIIAHEEYRKAAQDGQFGEGE